VIVGHTKIAKYNLILNFIDISLIDNEIMYRIVKLSVD